MTMADRQLPPHIDAILGVNGSSIEWSLLNSGSHDIQRNDEFNGATDRRHGAATFFQAVWPDQNSLYPLQAGLNSRYREPQPVLGITPSAGSSSLLH